jgi:hypothetical protein
MSSNPKFTAGEVARSKWRKPLLAEQLTIFDYCNRAVGSNFIKMADVVLDDGTVRRTTLQTVAVDEEKWKETAEHIYIITRNTEIMKIGGTRTGMKARWGSYLCGHCVAERMNKHGEPNPGKMSVTNAHLYHTIEHDLLLGNKWEFYSWKLPDTTVPVEIFGEMIQVVAQTYHAYESRCIELFKTITGHIPQLCDNADPTYKTKKE